jgi:LPXTG-site transpeptidase (sortase) family protein
MICLVGILCFSIVIFFLSSDLLGQGADSIFGSSTYGQIRQNLINGKVADSIQSVVVPEKAGLELPIRLKIPKIKVDADIESVGLTSDGAMAAPIKPANAAWYNLGPRPGEQGSSVIDGHFGWWKNGSQGVFNNLSKLQKGDKLYVQDGKGGTATFVVRESRLYDPNADASDVFNSDDGKSHLNLITCEGVWNKYAKQYSRRLVVFTDKV